MRHLLITAALAIVALTGCGGEDSPEDSIRSTAIEFADHLRDDKIGEACKLTEDQQECMSQLVLAKALVGDFASLIPDDYDDQVKASKVTIDGNSATLAIPDDPQRFVNRSGEWLIVIEMEKAE